MKKFLIGVATLGFAALAHATPLVIEESSRIAPPPGATLVWGQVGVDGDDAVVLDYYSYPVDDSEDPDYNTVTTAHLYHRSGTNWNWVRQLAQGTDNSADDATNHNPIAMKNGVLALAFEPMLIFERENGDWVQKMAGPPPGQPVIYHDPLREVRIDSGRIFLGSFSWGGSIYVKNTTTGNWEFQANLPGDDSGDGDNSVGGDIDLSANWAVVSSQYNWNDLPAPAMQVFHRSGTSWPLQARLVTEPGHTFSDVAIRDTELFIGDLVRYGVGVWRRDSSSQWYRADNLRTASDFTGPGPYGDGPYGNAIVKTSKYVFKQQWNADRGAFVVNVFQPDSASGAYRHVATLAAKNGDDLYESIAVSDRRVLVNGEHGPYYFFLPETFAPPALFQDTFSGNGSGWTSIPGSQFAVVQSGASRVFRQSSTAGDAGAVLDAHDWTHQSIQADVKPTAVNGTSAWVGLATRRLDASNFYYVTLRSSGAIQLKRHGNSGAFVTLASASAPWALNRNYRLRLESIGSLHRVYVDGNLVLEAWDGTIKHGQPGLLSYRAAVDYDNVVVSPSDTQTIYAPAYPNVWNPPQLQPEPWTYSGGGKWSWQYDGSNIIFKQTYTIGDARAAVGPPQIPNTDQIVEARIRPTVFNASGSPWVGLMARYVDATNFVYVQLRDSNVLRLRKLKNGSIVDLGTASLTVTPNTWYAVRLEAVGSQLRAYVNGKLILEVTDPEPVSGLVGLVTYRTAADYDDFRAVVP